MQNDNLKRFFCFLLCFILLISFVPRPAHAVGVDWILRQIATDIGVTGILEGLGLFRDSLNGDEYYNDLVSDVKNAAADAGLVSIDFMDVFYQTDPLGASSPLYAVPLTLISFVRNWVFDNGVVKNNVPSPPVGSDMTFSEAWSYAASQPYAFYFVEQGEYNRLFYSTSPIYRSGSYIRTSDHSKSICFFNGSSWSYGTAYAYVDEDISVTYFGTENPDIVSDFPLSLGVISPPDTLFNAAYPQWLEHQRELEDGATESVVQIGLGNTQAETESLTQEQIWSGQGTLTVPEVVPGAATLTDVISAIVALPGQLVTSITTALTNFFTISGESSSFGIQLKDFFPFCIPFDLFDFLTVLSAEPQAPVFKWEIPVPQLGRTFELEVDLTPWDSVASLFRTFELLAFIVGLALITREKFLRS